MEDTTQKKGKEFTLKGWAVAWEIIKGVAYSLDQRSINERQADTKLWLKNSLGKNGVIVPIKITYKINHP